MTRDEWVHLISHLIISVFCGVVVGLAGGPTWAQVMTFLVIYFTL